MANTYTLIESQVLGSSAASVTFSSIPATYTDLVLKWSVRTDYGATRTGFRLAANAITSGYTATYIIQYNSTTVGSGQDSAAYWNAEYIDGTGATANTFGSGEFYLPSYTASQNKPASMFSVAEGNSAADTGMYVKALLLSNTAAVTSLTLTANTGNFVTDSSFYLYGIKTQS
jgi:hypothetical protein